MWPGLMWPGLKTRPYSFRRNVWSGIVGGFHLAVSKDPALRPPAEWTGFVGRGLQTPAGKRRAVKPSLRGA